MKRIGKILVGLFVILSLFVGSFSFAQKQPASQTTSTSSTSSTSSSSSECNGIKLNTNVPIVGNCITLSSGNDGLNSFKYLMQALIKLVMSITFVVCFMMIIVGGIMYSYGDAKTGIKLIKRVAWIIGLLGSTGALLKLINPTFFG